MTTSKLGENLRWGVAIAVTLPIVAVFLPLALVARAVDEMRERRGDNQPS